MNLIDECALSCYEETGEINKEHHIKLVQHTETGKFFVKKPCPLYQHSMFSALKDHPIKGMPKIYELIEADGELILIEEYMTGDTLEEKLSSHGKYSESETVAWILELCEIVTKLHSFQPPIIHRDIKPTNIIISPDNSVKLLDLSAARQSSVEKSQDTVMMGTVGYAAPEQYGFSTSSPATDIYAIGVVMNKMLTCKMLNEEHYDGGLGKIIDTCTMLKPEERYRDVSELISSLKKYSAGENKTNKTILIKSAIPDTPSWRKYLPPGFRSGSPAVLLIAALCYVFLFSVSMTLNVKNADSTQTVINRVCVTVMFLAVVLFSGNYLGIQSRFPLAKSQHLPVRILGIVLWDFLIMFAIAIVAVLLGG